MSQDQMHALLEAVAQGKVGVEDAMLCLKKAPFDDFGSLPFAKLDHHRAIRQGIPEVIWGAGKTAEQIDTIARAMRESGEKTVLITRMSSQAADAVGKTLPLDYDTTSRLGLVGERRAVDGMGTIVVATGGTSDIPVAQEAALTAEVCPGQVFL